MSEEIKGISNNAEIIDFGEYLNSLDDSNQFEMENQAGQMQTFSRDEVIKRFQDFYDKKTVIFKIRLSRFRDGKLLSETKEFTRPKTT
jgi:hypothetical protein